MPADETFCKLDQRLGCRRQHRRQAASQPPHRPERVRHAALGAQMLSATALFRAVGEAPAPRFSALKSPGCAHGVGRPLWAPASERQARPSGRQLGFLATRGQPPTELDGHAITHKLDLF